MNKVTCNHHFKDTNFIFHLRFMNWERWWSSNVTCVSNTCCKSLASIPSFFFSVWRARLKRKRRMRKNPREEKRSFKRKGNKQTRRRRYLTSLDKFCYVIVKHCTNSLVHLCNCCLCICLLIVYCCKCSTRGVLTLSNVNKVRKC